MTRQNATTINPGGDTTMQAVATETGAPVINFAEKSAEAPRRKRVGKRPDHPDADLIEHCIEYAMQIAAGRAAFGADPTDAEFAGYFDRLSQARADRALNEALNIRPETFDGLRVKASCVEIAMQDWDNFDSVMIDDLRKKFLISLAADVTRFQQSAMDQKTSHVAIAEPRR